MQERLTLGRADACHHHLARPLLASRFGQTIAHLLPKKKSPRPEGRGEPTDREAPPLHTFSATGMGQPTAEPNSALAST